MPESPKRRFPLHQRARSSRPGFTLPRDSGNATAGGALWIAGMVGLVVLGNHGTQFDVQQTRYASREECMADWGTEGSCAQGTGSGQSSTYFGPRYYWDPDRGRPVVVNSDGSEHVATSTRVGPAGSPGRTSVVGSFARGGFGGIGRGFSSGHGG
jgi:hypothetical protein